MFKMNDRRPVVALIVLGTALWASVAAAQQEDAGKSGSKEKAKPAVMVPAPVPAQIRSASVLVIVFVYVAKSRAQLGHNVLERIRMQAG